MRYRPVACAVGISRTPFTKELVPSMLFGSSSHQQAVARISWVVQERALGVVCGEVGAGEDRRRESGDSRA